VDVDRQFLDYIFDHPDDDEARLVYADALLERGDPRGGFIMRQMRGVRDPGDYELILEHAEEWMEGLFGAAEQHAFGRGFVQSCNVGRLSGRHRTLRSWGTVRALTVRSGFDFELLYSGLFRGLWRLSAPPELVEQMLASERTLPFTHLLISGEPSGSSRLFRAESLPGLHRLSMTSTSSPTQLAERCLYLAPRLESVVCAWDGLRLKIGRAHV
jgi:uncharacterized protein (TIGR02996 family)